MQSVFLSIDVNFISNESLSLAWKDFGAFISLLRLQDGNRSSRESYLMSIFYVYKNTTEPMKSFLDSKGFCIRGDMQNVESTPFIDAHSEFDEHEFNQVEAIETMFQIIHKHVKNGIIVHKELSDGCFYEWHYMFEKGKIKYSQAEIISRFKVRPKAMKTGLSDILDSLE